MADVFISFVEQDRSVSEEIAAALAGTGAAVWWEPSAVPPDGRAHSRADVLTSARCVVVLWSPHSVKNDTVLADADYARGRDSLVSVMLGKPALPLGFRDVWYADLTQWDGDPEDERFHVLKRLVEARLAASGPRVPAKTGVGGADAARQAEPPGHQPVSNRSEQPAAALGISIRLRNGDLLDVEADAIAVQYPQRLHGLIDRVVRICSVAKRPVLLPQPGVVRLLEVVAGITARRILIVGVAPVQAYDYRDLRSFAKRAVTHLASVPGVHRVALPVYGPPGYRLDEVKAFEAEVGGVLDGMRETQASGSLNAIALIERDLACVERLTSVLSDMMTPGSVMQAGAHGTDSSVAASARPFRTPPRPQHRSTLFLCYRRQDTEDAAGRLYDRLVAAFGAERVFMDIDSVPLGIDFVDHVTEQISRCSAVIVMIGRQWLTVKDKKRRRRLDSEDDLVRAEIRAALQQKIPVIPVVVQNASMPHPDDLPEDIRRLTRRNGIYLRSEQWRDGVDRLLRELDGLIEGRSPS